MKLDIKGIITKESLESDVRNLDKIMGSNDYAIIVDKGIGKYVVFDIDFVKKNILLRDEVNKIKNYKKSPYTLVEAMIKTLEDVPEKKANARVLASLVLDYYGKKASPVTIRTRAEENANGKSETNYFIIEPGNIIGLAPDSGYNLYMYNKFKRAVNLELIKQFKNKNTLDLPKTIERIKLILDSLAFTKYNRNFIDNDIIEIITSFDRYKVTNNTIQLRSKQDGKD